MSVRFEPSMLPLLLMNLRAATWAEMSNAFSGPADRVELKFEGAMSS